MYIWRKRVTTGWLRGPGKELMDRFGSAVALIERPGKVRASLEVCCARKTQAQELVRKCGGSIEKLRPDWLENFAKRTEAKPVRVGSRLVVLRTKVCTAGRSIVVPAEAAFGTGEHATTAMCLRMLERITRRWDAGWAMLDAGTGSGILALAASCFGAARIVAIDNDPRACTIAARNARANKIRNVDFRIGDVLNQRPTGRFDVITANLFSEILIKVLPVWSRHLAKDGCLILSGILRSEEEPVMAALARNRFRVQESKRRGKWIALLAFARKKG